MKKWGKPTPLPKLHVACPLVIAATGVLYVYNWDYILLALVLY